MALSGLPEDGELRLGSITLPAGKRIVAGYGSGEPVAWVTLREVPGAGRAWAALSEAHEETSLVPFLLSGLDDGTDRPWDKAEFDDPADVSELDHMDAASLLRDLWHDAAHEAEEGEEEDEDFIEYVQESLGPFGLEFPGLAHAEDQELGRQRLDEVLGGWSAARIGLVSAGRPADVLPLIGWIGACNCYQTSLPIAAVLRSWEDRFGARLLEVGFAQIRLLASRPPRTFAAAERVAAEHVVFCDECGGQGLREVSTVAASLMDTPVWTFWWD